MPAGDRLDRWLDSVPGYAGYRDKERRRDSDRVIRDQLALDYGQLAERLGRLATSLADRRQLAAVGAVDKPHRRLVSFMDRLRGATYGYAPIFAQAEADDRALDQIAAFDRALGDQQSVLTQQIAALEAAEPGSAAFRELSGTLSETIEGLHDRFDHRAAVIQTGKPATQENVLVLLEPRRPGGTPVAYRLHEGEAVSHGGQNYTVVGRVSVESPTGAWRAFQMRGGSGDEWLLVSTNRSGPLYWLRRIEFNAGAGDAAVTLEGQTYNLESIAEGTGEVHGPQGAAMDQTVRMLRYRPADGTGVLLVYQWGSGNLVLAGAEIDPGELQVFSREQ
jgi:hypothetical protein